MQKLKISFRLKTLIDQTKLIPIDIKKIADIGTDHGYLPYKMFESSLISKSILCDINDGPLENAKQTFNNSEFKEHASFRLGSGIEPLNNGEVDVVFIAGMGGGLIQDILSKDLDKTRSFQYYVLQPMTEQNQLRSWLIENGFEILWDHFFTDANKHYEMCVVSSKLTNTAQMDSYEIPGDDLEFGKRILTAQVSNYLDFLYFKSKKYQIISNQIRKEGNTDNSEKINMCYEKLKTIQMIIDDLN